MATGTAQLLSSRDENNVLGSDEEIDEELLPIVPEPVKDGLPQVRTKHGLDVRLMWVYRPLLMSFLQMFACIVRCL